ncbi:MAG TPA: beta-ketoacyl synthase chain length factor [Gammaproteobacteria bacterium]|nr:beta-ketoacyl synthase chain length factor [Gammaproteobacteria bacterium]
MSDAAGWRLWLTGVDAVAGDFQPDVNFLPAMLRRRLDRHGRMAMHTAWSCAEGLDSVQFVFASRHGDLGRTLELLTALGNKDMLSPTSFSLSVHNSTAGLFSIARGDRSAATAMAAGADTLGLCMLEGANMIAEGASRVLVCYADDMPPSAYLPYLVEDPARLPFSISLLLTQPDAASLTCRLTRHTSDAKEAPETALMRFLIEAAADSIIGVDQPWRLERSAHAH